MSETQQEQRKPRIRTERMEVLTNPEDVKLDLVQVRIKNQKERFLKELKERLGLIMITCDATGISHSTIRNWAKTDPEFRDKLNDVGNYTLDVVEQSLLNKIVTEKDTTAMIFYLKTKGRDRGFSQRVEVTGANGGAVQTETTLKLSEIEKEVPADVLDAVVTSIQVNNLQPVAQLPSSSERLAAHVAQPASQKAIETAIGYTLDDDEEDDEKDIELG